MDAMRTFLVAMLCVAVTASAASAVSPMEMHELLVPDLQEVRPYGEFVFEREPEQATSQRAQYKSTLYELYLQANLFPSITDRQMTLQFKGRMQDLAEGMTLPSTRAPLPDPLFDAGMGATYRFRTQGGNLVGLNLGFFSASDDPFNDGHGPDVSANVFLRMPRPDREAWVLYLHYLNTRDYAPGIPLPGVGYSRRAVDGSYDFFLGLPYAAGTLRPSEKVRLTASYLAPKEIRFEAGYRVAAEMIPFTIHANFDWRTDRYRNSNRRGEDDLLSIEEKRFYGGFRLDMGESTWMDLVGGFAFDRALYEGEECDDDDFNRVDVSDGAYYGLRIRSVF